MNAKSIFKRLIGILSGIAIGVIGAMLVGVTLAQTGSSALVAAPQSATAPGTMSYQGRILQVNGQPYTGQGYFKFAVVDGSTYYWTNDGLPSATPPFTPTNPVTITVNNGLVSVLLGDNTIPNMSPLSAGVFSGQDRRLRIWFSQNGATYERLSPDVQLASVPYAFNSEALAGQPATFYLDASNINTGTLSQAHIDATMARVSQITPTVWMNAGAGSGLDADLLDGQHGAFYRYAGNINAGTLSQTYIDPAIVRASQITASVAAAGFITGGQSLNASNITTGALNQAYIDPAMARLNQVVPAVAAAGFITQSAADARYARINPTTQQIALLKWYGAISTTQSNIAVGAGPTEIAFDGFNMWVGNSNSNTVSVLRTNDGYHVMTPTVGYYPLGMAYDGINMWVANAGDCTVNVIRASDGYHVMTPTIIAPCYPRSIAFDGVNMWVVNPWGNNVSVLRASDGYHVMTPTVGNDPYAIAFDGVNMWVTNDNSGNISVLRASDGYHVMTPTVGNDPRAMAFDGVNMWVTNRSIPGYVSVLRANDGAQIMTIPVGADPRGIAFDGANMWVSNEGSAPNYNVSVIRVSDGYHVMTPTVGVYPVGVAFDGAHMWVVNNASGTVSKR